MASFVANRSQAKKARKELNGMMAVAKMEMDADIQKQESETLFYDEMSWVSQNTTHRTCKKLHEYILVHDILSPMSLAAIWRLINCKKCGFVYHPRIAASPSLAEYYVRFGGDLKILHSKKPKLLIRDLPAIKDAVRKGIKPDPKMKPGAVKSAADNTYLFEQLGDVAVLAGMIDPEYVSIADLETPLFQRLIARKAYDSLPCRFAYDTLVANKDKNSYQNVLSRLEILNLREGPEFAKGRHVRVLTIGAAAVSSGDIGLQQYLFSYKPKLDENLDDLPNRLYKVLKYEDRYREHIKKRVLDVIEEIGEANPGLDPIYDERMLEYIHYDVSGILAYEDGHRTPVTYDFMVKEGRDMHMRFDKETGNLLSKFRSEIIGKDWMSKPAMTALEIRSMLIDRFLQRCLKEMQNWTFGQFANCQFDEFIDGAHPATCFVRKR